jgi:uncharacterized protein
MAGGGMSKLLLIVLIAALVYSFWKKGQGVHRAQSGGAASRGAPPAVQEMLKCARCGVHFPLGEAVMRDGRAYCSLAHAQGSTD